MSKSNIISIIVIICFIITIIFKLEYDSKYVTIKILENETWYFEDNYISYNETNIITNGLVKSVKYGKEITIVIVNRKMIEK